SHEVLLERAGKPGRQPQPSPRIGGPVPPVHKLSLRVCAARARFVSPGPVGWPWRAEVAPRYGSGWTQRWNVRPLSWISTRSLRLVGIDTQTLGAAISTTAPVPRVTQ